MRSSQSFALRPSLPPPHEQLLSSASLVTSRSLLPTAAATAPAAPRVVDPLVVGASTRVPSVLPASTAARAGLPLLPSLAASCSVDPPRTIHPFAWDNDTLSVAIVDGYGDVSTRESVRAKLVQFYADTHQLGSNSASSTSTTANDTTAPTTTTSNGISEMTLRIDTELELLRQQCFAERNAQWHYATPAMFTYEPISDPLWAPQLVGNSKIALQRLKHDAPTERESEKDATAAVPIVAGVVSQADARGFPLGEWSRDRPWPPRVFAQKAATAKPPRGRGGKRKVPIIILEERSALSKVCAHCRTQSTPLWRKLAKENDAWIAVAGSEQPPQPLAPTSASASASPATEAIAIAPVATPAMRLVDVCLRCFLHLQRSDVFQRKMHARNEKVRQRKQQLALAIAMKAKQQKQLAIAAKKQQLAKSKKRRPATIAKEPVGSVAADEATMNPTPSLTLKFKFEMQKSTADALSLQSEKQDGQCANSDAIDKHAAADAMMRSALKRERKKSKKDKKKKKKKKRRVDDKHQRVVHDNDDDDTNDRDSATLVPSPPQRSGHYEYADTDRSIRLRASSFDNVNDKAPVAKQPLHDTRVSVSTAPVQETVAAVEMPAKRTRKLVNRLESGDLQPAGAPPAPSSTSPVRLSSTLRRRKSSNAQLPVVAIVPTAAATRIIDDDNDDDDDDDEEEVEVVDVPKESVRQPPPTTRPSRARAASATTPTATTPSPAPIAAAAGATSTRKRSTRTTIKKESNRERELRALGQYCPVCNATYEEDDESTFVCCDSCEMWIHGTCDTTLTPKSIASLAESNDKYICPLCAGR